MAELTSDGIAGQVLGLRRQLLDELARAASARDVEAVRVKYLGQKGLITTLRKGVDFGQMSADERKAFGQAFNEVKAFAEEEIGRARAAREAGEQARGARAQLDLTLPGTGHAIGSMHPVAVVQMFLEDIFRGMGFMVQTGYEVETEYFNFDALNIPGDHPAREMQDTFWLENGLLLRTHTSASQVRALLEFGAPIRAIFPGRCFRYESVDASHETSFHQLEGLMVDENVSVATLIAVMKVLLSEVFARDVSVRLRPGYFPFVEPGFELDLQCLICGGGGCRTCKQTGWIELIPCGLVHPKVLAAGKIDPDRYSGFAFGLGLTRLAMMKYSIPDIRVFHAGDIRFHEQFPATL
jgi:phenylalanyl-tRNA synthetase alpha chain